MESTESRCKVAILDNCEIEILYRLSREKVPVEETLESYDVILIPGWVWTEVCDSRYREDYVKSLIEKGLPIKIIPEEQYIKIVNKELILLKLFDLVIRPYGYIKGYLNRDILKGKEEAEIDYLYNDWIKKIYCEWPIIGEKIVCSDGSIRKSKKNAGEISIAYLACLLRYQSEWDVDLTIWSHDSDCKNCIDKINERLCKENREIILSYKNVDIIFKELYEKNILIAQEIDSLIDKIRNERRMIYILRKEDNTVELRRERIDNVKLKELIYSDICEIIW